ncbi:Ubox domain containing protein, partial [Acanthamoeba castellanii str. Neff]
MDTDICEFLDPISLTPMEEAMVTSCGHSFSKSSILQWLASHPTNARCPVCNATLKPDGLAPNWALRSAIAKFAPGVTSTAGSHLSFDTRGQAEASAPLITVKPCKNEKACTQPTTYRTIQIDDAPPTGWKRVLRRGRGAERCLLLLASALSDDLWPLEQLVDTLNLVSCCRSSWCFTSASAPL